MQCCPMRQHLQLIGCTDSIEGGDCIRTGGLNLRKERTIKYWRDASCLK